jgi:ribosome-binding protein aMBF1 (putative translation factor)
VEYPLFVRGEGKYAQGGDTMKCDFCGREALNLISLRVYTREGIQVCKDCYEEIQRHLHRPYSKVMDKLALAEAGYYVNRKMAKPLTRWQ